MVGQQKKMGKPTLTHITLEFFLSSSNGAVPAIYMLFPSSVPSGWKPANYMLVSVYVEVLSTSAAGGAGGSLTRGCKGGFRGGSNRVAAAAGSCSGSGSGSGADFEFQLAGRNKYPFSRSCSSG